MPRYRKDGCIVPGYRRVGCIVPGCRRAGCIVPEYRDGMGVEDLSVVWLGTEGLGMT